MATVHEPAAIQSSDWTREHQFCHLRSWCVL